MFSRSFFVRLSVLFVCLFVLPFATQVFAASPDVVISQVYGGGGNAGAPYKNDFVELFNRGSAPVSLTNWSVQYASSSGTTWNVAPLSGTIQPGQYYLVRLAGGAAGVDLPTPDATGTLNLSGTGGKVALANITTALAGGCPRVTSPNVIDFAGYGSTPCFEGATAVPTLSNTTAGLRTNACVDDDQNGAEFTASAPNPRNSAYPLAPCGGTPTNPVGVGTATPSSVDRGSDVTLSVSVTGGTAPYVVVADLSTIGGAADTAFAADVAGTTFTLTYTVSSGTTAGVKSIPFTVTDASSNSGNGTISLTVTVPPVSASIPEIQGTGDVSPYVGQVVTTTGVVTAKRGNSFYIQSETEDGDPLTSEGLYIYSGTSWPDAVVGNKVTVTGTISEYYNLTELAPTAVSLISTGATLPEPVALNASTDFTQLERYESMRVTGDFAAIAPTEANVTESTATATTNGRFWAVVDGVARPFREPGVEPGATLPLAPTVPVFDGNPERIKVETGVLAGTSKLSVFTGATFAGATGVLDYSFGAFTLLPETNLTVDAPPPLESPRAPYSNEFTVATWNLLHFYDTTAPNTTVTADAYARRLNKVSVGVRDVLGTPDIIGVQEVENIAVLTEIANKINNDAVAAGKPNPNYVPYLEEGNDLGGIDVGFLVRSDRITVKGVTQVYKELTITHPGGNVYELFDRPPLVLEAAIKQGAREFPVHVVSLHLRSLSGVEETGNSGIFARDKRKQGAEKVAELLQDLQANGGNVIALGDFNAYQFSDGYVDVTGTVTGAPAPREEVYVETTDLVDPNFVNLTTTVEESDRYSYSYGGNAQTLDHIVASASLLARPAEMHFVHLNSDTSESLYGDGTTPLRVSDHDPAVAYFTLPPTPISATASLTPAAITAGESTLLAVSVTPGEQPASTGITVSADLSAIGGSATAAMYDDGTNGDIAGGDNVFSLSVTVPAETATSSPVIPFAIADAQARTATASVALQVTAHSPTGIGATALATPADITAGDSTLLTVSVTPGAYPASSGIAVAADLSSIGGVASALLYDDGTHGDATAGDNTFSLSVTVPAETATSSPVIPFAIADAQARTATASITLQVTAHPPVDITSTAVATPASITAGESTLFAVTVTPGMYPSSTGISVAANLSAIGGSVAAVMYDDGTHGDTNAGDNTFSLAVTVPDVTATSSPVIVFSVADAQGRTASPSVTLTVTALPPTQPTLVATATPSTAVIGTSMLLTATVTPGAYPTSSGITVTADLSSIGGANNALLYDDATHGDITAADNVFSIAATLETSTAPGMKTINVSIADAQGRTATSSTKITVPQPDFAVSATSTTATVLKGASATYSLSASSNNGFTGTVTFTCTGAPEKSTCTVTPATADVAPNASKTVTVTVATQADKTSAASGPAGSLMFAMMLLGGVVVVTTRGKAVRATGAALVLVFAVGMSACGGGSEQKPKQVVEGTKTGSYTLTVTATSGSASHATTLNLTVTK